MRIALHVDSAPTGQIRILARALHRAGLTGQLKVGLNGPEAWSAETPPLSAEQFAIVTRELAS